MAHDYKIGTMRAEAVSHYSSPEKCWKMISSFPSETFQLPDGTRPFAGVDLGVHRTARLIVCRPPPLILPHQHSDVNVNGKSKMYILYEIHQPRIPDSSQL